MRLLHLQLESRYIKVKTLFKDFCLSTRCRMTNIRLNHAEEHYRMWLPEHEIPSYLCLILVVLWSLFIYTRLSWFANPFEMEDDMENAVMATQILANLGIFLAGAGVMWFVTVYKEKKE